MKYILNACFLTYLNCVSNFRLFQCISFKDLSVFLVNI